MRIPTKWATRVRRSLPVLCLIGAGAAPVSAAVLPGFTDTLYATVSSPTAIAFTPDGRLLVTSQGGTLSVVPAGGGTPVVAMTIPAASICTNSERGLLGVAVSPGFATSKQIFLFYTFKTAGSACFNRVSRFTLQDSNVVTYAGEVVLVDNMPSPAGNHNAGDLGFGKDGYLYISIGDGGCDYANDSGCAGANDAARDEFTLTGKVLRIAEDGSIPSNNPFQGAGTARCNVTGGTTPGSKCQETFAWGLRNPFRLAFDPNAAGTRLFINDVGQGVREEIDLGQAGVDYGWYCREGTRVNSTTGKCSPTPPGMVDPIFEYSHGAVIPGTTSPTNCNCISGGAFVPNGLWPGYDGAYLFGDCTCGEMFKVDATGAITSAADFGNGMGTLVHMTFGPSGGRQALYYTTFNSGGQVRRIDGPPSPASTRYNTVPPCRLVDTRQAAGPYGGPALAAGSNRSFVAGGVCGIPTTAKAVALNVTVTAPTATGNFTLYATGTTVPNTSVLNFSTGQTRANNATVSLGTGGALSLFCSMPNGSAHAIIDVAGYFE